MKSWFGVKGLFRWYLKSTGDTAHFEERVLLFQAANIDEALDMAEQEATTYCAEDLAANFRIESLHRFSAYSIEGKPRSGIELFSRLIDSKLPSENYIRRFHPRSHDHTGE